MQKKIAITIDENLLAQIDRLVEAKVYPNRSRAIEANLQVNEQKLRRQIFELECLKLNSAEEKEEAELGGFDNWTDEVY